MTTDSLAGKYLRVRGEEESFSRRLRRFRKYLRVRGEELLCGGHAGSVQEIPPRARRRVRQLVGSAEEPGNTSACAEKRAGQHIEGRVNRKYLRVRGEEPWSL